MFEHKSQELSRKPGNPEPTESHCSVGSSSFLVSCSRLSMQRLIYMLTAIAVAVCTPTTRAAQGDPPFHPSVGQRFVPTDVNWDKPAYQSTFDDASELKNWRLDGL